MKKAGFMKDALILFAITLISGVLLGGVYEMTKTVIAEKEEAAKQETYREVYADAASFALNEELTEKAATADLSSYDKVTVSEILDALDASGTVIGHLATSTSGAGYGGNVTLTIGITNEGAITGIGFLTLNETPGLGMKVADDAFKGQFVGKNAEQLTLVKGGGASGEDEIDAISGATVTSSAVTNAVNAALFLVASN
ncbi:MAG: RnfABCDGE type electron transport complex subunit G [bacterium]|nr:RnfABCDGE type electron transport complex subunit G [bacterium]